MHASRENIGFFGSSSKIPGRNVVVEPKRIEEPKRELGKISNSTSTVRTYNTVLNQMTATFTVRDFRW